MIVEGIHLVPATSNRAVRGALVVQLVIAVDDEEAHRSHFYIREVQTKADAHSRSTRRTSTASGSLAATSRSSPVSMARRSCTASSSMRPSRRRWSGSFRR